jgi:hypothetical protein
MKNITVKDGITVICKKVPEEYILLLSCFSVLQRFIAKTRVCVYTFAYVLILVLNFMCIQCMGPSRRLAGSKVKLLDRQTDRPKDRQTDTPRDGSEISLLFCFLMMEG